MTVWTALLIFVGLTSMQWSNKLPNEIHRIDFRRFAYDSIVREHAELWDAWKVIEAKAQPVSAATGVFLAGVFAYATQLPKTASTFERLLLLIVAALLVIAIVQSLRAIWVVDAASPHLGHEGSNEVDDILKSTQAHERLSDRFENLLNNTTNRWASSCESIRKDLNRKSNFLVCALKLLAWAAGGVFFLLLETVFLR
ncbi:hypothetical protein [Rhodoferax sp. U11-2br]|uniref:hypothetical protein n=1 Tax=Rhodoferax sp. U11-2br TaxID=2838878 RepID=UPI001BE692CF|nr:hypothetical protein [Rhodoferax sp. U11-2br]MBT3068401.1 hypothetical protein [Rhodoferax sp. U11-2br]